MNQHSYGTAYSLFTVQGYEWTSLTELERTSVHNLLTSPQLRGSAPYKYGFVQTTPIDDTLYYGIFTQQYTEVVKTYKDDDASQYTTEPVYPFEDRFFALLPKDNLLVLERRRFLRQPGLTPSGTENKIEQLLQEHLPRYHIGLERYSHDLDSEQLRRLFYEYQVVGVTVAGLRNRHVPDDFIFFNPHFEKNAISRELFDTKILPFMDALNVQTDAYNEPRVIPAVQDDLRKNPLARVGIETATEIKEVAIQHPEKGRQHIKPHYDDILRISVETDDPDTVISEILDRINELPDRPTVIQVRPTRRVQRTLFDIEGSE